MLKKFISDSPKHEILFLGSKVKDTNMEHVVFSSGCLGKNYKLTNTITYSVFKIQLSIKKILISFHQIFPCKPNLEKIF